jgi:hypothetical protein
MDYTRFNETGFLGDFDNVLAWLADRGFTQNNRLRKYRKNIDEVQTKEAKSSAGDVYAKMLEAGRLNEILATYVEGFEITDSLMTLSATQVDIPDELLRRMLDGPADASLETPRNSQGRNAMFEISIGAMLARQNLQPKFSLGNPDVEFQFDERRVLVECKRVVSDNGTLANISDGISQLKKTVDLSRGEIGLVAINVSRCLMYQGNGLWNVPAHISPQEAFWRMLREFIDGLGYDFQRKRDDSTLGVLFYAASPFSVEGMGMTPARTGTFCRFDLGHDEFLLRLASSLRL